MVSAVSGSPRAPGRSKSPRGMSPRRSKSPRSPRRSKSPRKSSLFDDDDEAYSTKRQRKQTQLGKNLLLQRQLSRAAQMAKDLGPQSREAFIKHLKRQFGSIPRAWRLGLDPRNNGKLNKANFFASARAIGYCSSLNSLWRDLDADETGFITMDELDPEAASLTLGFKDKLKEHYGSVLQAWLKIDANGTGRVEEPELAEVCKRLGYHGKAKKLFAWYDYDHSGFISLDEIDPEAAASWRRGDHEHGLLAESSAAARQENLTLPFWQRTSTMSSRRRSAIGCTRAQQCADLRRAQDEFAQTANIYGFEVLAAHAVKDATRGKLDRRVRRFCDTTEEDMKFLKSCPTLPRSEWASVRSHSSSGSHSRPHTSGWRSVQNESTSWHSESSPELNGQGAVWLKVPSGGPPRSKPKKAEIDEESEESSDADSPPKMNMDIWRALLNA
jgi:Ca2+-binding EF-hand superfamily protein